jgi:hypothetical protein
MDQVEYDPPYHKERITLRQEKITKPMDTDYSGCVTEKLGKDDDGSFVNSIIQHLKKYCDENMIVSHFNKKLIQKINLINFHIQRSSMQ